MSEYKIGMLAKSKAGHDDKKVYVVVKIDSDYVYLADGSIRTIDNPKKKKKKHVQVINIQHDIATADDVAIKRILKEYKERSYLTGRI